MADDDSTSGMTSRLVGPLINGVLSPWASAIVGCTWSKVHTNNWNEDAEKRGMVIIIIIIIMKSTIIINKQITLKNGYGSVAINKARH